MSHLIARGKPAEAIRDRPPLLSRSVTKLANPSISACNTEHTCKGCSPAGWEDTKPGVVEISLGVVASCAVCVALDANCEAITRASSALSVCGWSAGRCGSALMFAGGVNKGARRRYPPATPAIAAAWCLRCGDDWCWSRIHQVPDSSRELGRVRPCGPAVVVAAAATTPSARSRRPQGAFVRSSPTARPAPQHQPARAHGTTIIRSCTVRSRRR
jgi:hypothetical protein